MVKLLSIIFFNHLGHGNEPAMLASEFEVSSFGYFYQSGVREVCTFASRELTKRCSKGQTESIVHAGYHVHTIIYPAGLAVVCATDSEYPTMAARSFLQRTAELFRREYPEETSYSTITSDKPLALPSSVRSLLSECQDPTKADKLIAIRASLEETKQIILNNIEVLLERDESLNDLMQRSQDLSFQSKAFAKKSGDLNSCCTIF